MFAVLKALGETPPPVIEPAAAIRDPIKPDHIVCLEDGRKLKLLRRHLRITYNMTPEQYREKWLLRRDCSMVAPNYSMFRSRLAVEWGLRRARRRTAAAADVAVRMTCGHEPEPSRTRSPRCPIS